jgi:hypothetical protein
MTPTLACRYNLVVCCYAVGDRERMRRAFLRLVQLAASSGASDDLQDGSEEEEGGGEGAGGLGGRRACMRCWMVPAVAGCVHECYLPFLLAACWSADALGCLPDKVQRKLMGWRLEGSGCDAAAGQSRPL